MVLSLASTKEMIYPKHSRDKSWASYRRWYFSKEVTWGVIWNIQFPWRREEWIDPIIIHNEKEFDKALNGFNRERDTQKVI